MRGTLKCDACEYRETEIHEMTADLIGAPCPICGANLLTQEDFDQCKAMGPAIELLKNIGVTYADKIEDGTISLNAHKGTVTIKRTGR